jgi:dipeptidyl aminopeptidase/acylaminoacyl peptidase
MIRPVLIIYGERDFRVNPEQSEKMIAELKKLQKDVHTLKFVNEGHGINRLSNSIQMYQAIEDFLARHLGGRSDGTKGDKL